jgi:hypothetical protein
MSIGASLGFPVEDFYSEFFVMNQDPDDARSLITKALEDNGLANLTPDNDGLGDYIFFGNARIQQQFFGVGFITEKDMKDLGFVAPSGFLPEGSTFAVLYTYPLD